MRKCKTDKCSCCGDIKKIHCKEMCQKCYVKAYRKTPTGKKALLDYNKGKGVESRKRFRRKHHKPKQPKTTTYCNCGKIVLAKGLCVQCYHRKRNSVKNPRKPKQPKTISDEQFQRLIELVAIGVPVYKAVLSEGITKFYDIATDIQKIEIKLYKDCPITEDFNYICTQHNEPYSY